MKCEAASSVTGALSCPLRDLCHALGRAITLPPLICTHTRRPAQRRIISLLIPSPANLTSHVLHATGSDAVEVDIEEDTVSLGARRAWPVCAAWYAPRSLELLGSSGGAMVAMPSPRIPLHSSQMERMEKTMEATRRSFGTVRTGRANPAALDRVMVRGRDLCCPGYTRCICPERRRLS